MQLLGARSDPALPPRDLALGASEPGQFPVGLIPTAEYSSATTRCDGGDVFLMLTDGIVEVAYSRDEEFGLERVERLVVENSARPLAELAEILIVATWAQSRHMDDQTILLVRPIG